MDELLAKMTQHAKVEAEEKQRLMLFTLNGQARRDPVLAGRRALRPPGLPVIAPPV